jgi:hypothetical protein
VKCPKLELPKNPIDASLPIGAPDEAFEKARAKK